MGGNWARACVRTAREISLCDETRGTILITRPEPAATETAVRVTAMGFHPVVAPMMTIRTMAPLQGQDSRAVLAEAGVSAADIEALKKSGALIEP